MQSLLRTVTDLHCARAFRTKVDPRRYPDYYLLIPSPMDLRTMRKKLSDNAYPSIDDFHNDAMLLFDNCKRYTPDPLHPIRKQCDELERRFDAKWQTFVTKKNTEAVAESGKRGRKPGKKVSLSLEFPTNSDNSQLESTSDSPELVMKVSKTAPPAPTVTYEEELELDYHPHGPSFESVVKFAVPNTPVESLKVVIPPPTPPAPPQPTAVCIPYPLSHRKMSTFGRHCLHCFPSKRCPD